MPYIEDWVWPIPAIEHVMQIEGCGRFEAMRQISGAARDGKLRWIRYGSHRFDWDGLKVYRADLLKLWPPPKRPDQGRGRPLGERLISAASPASYSDVKQAVQKRGRASEAELLKAVRDALEGKHVPREYVRRARDELFGKPGRTGRPKSPK
jgi:hypothetical protein